jgi:solute:Na+ symporter, SSS family
MKLIGLHWIDVVILVAYIVTVLAIGHSFSKAAKGEQEFFLGGRSLGRWFQFFLSFGNSTDPSQATTTASSVYRQGAGGAWLALILLFVTPYFWFFNVWFVGCGSRRPRSCSRIVLASASSPRSTRSRR